MHRRQVTLICAALLGLAPLAPSALAQSWPARPIKLVVPYAAGGATDIGALYDELQKRGISLDALEDGLLQQAVDRAGGNLSAAARALGITRPQLSYRLQRLKER